MKQQKNPQEASSFAVPQNWEEALDMLERALGKKPGDSALLLEKAHLFFKMGFYKECLNLCQSLAASENSRWESLLLQSSCENWLFRREKLIAAIRNYTPLPRNELHRNLASMLSVLCDSKEAVSYLTVISAQEKDPQLWCLLAAFQRADGKLKEALATLEKALALDSAFPPATSLREKIKVEILRAATKQQVDYSDTMVHESRSGFNAEDWMVRGLGNIRDRNYTEALKSFAEALKIEPALHVCWYFVGKVQQIMGGPDKAKQCYKKFIEGFPRSSGFYREQIFSSQIRMAGESVDELYCRWIGYFPGDYRSWMAYLRHLTEDGDLESARLLATEIRENVITQWHLSPASPEFLDIRGLLDLSLDRTRSASQSFLQALKANSNDALACLGLGKCCEKMGRFDEAQKYYEKASSMNNSRVLSLYQRASVSCRKHDRNSALSFIDEAQKCMGASRLLKSKKASILLDSGDVNAFLLYCSQIDGKDSSSTHLRLLKSIAYSRLQKYNEAIKDLDEIRAKEPPSGMILKNLAILCLKAGFYDRSLAFFEEMRKHDCYDAEMFLAEGISHYFLKHYENSLNYLESYMNLLPLDPRLWSFVAFAEYEMGNVEIAEVAFRKAHELCGGHHQSCLNLGILYSEKGNFDKALEILGRLKEGPAHVLLFLCRAKCFKGIKNHEQAMKNVMEALRLDPSHFTAVMLKGLIEFETGDFPAALNTFSKAQELDRMSPEAWYSKGFTFIHMNNTQGALESINQALALKPSFYEAWLAKAVVYWSLSNLEEAEKALKSAQNLNPEDFATWLKYASSQSDYRSSLKFYQRLVIPFSTPVVFSLDVEDPVGIFHYELLDSVFSR